MRSISDGKSSTTTLSWIPRRARSCWINASIRSCSLLPALVIIENSTLLPALSTKALPERRKPACSQQRQGSGVGPRGRLHRGIQPEMVCHRNRTGSRARVPVINDANDIVAADGFGNRAPEIARTGTSAACTRARRVLNLVEENGLPIERRPGVHHRARHLGRQPVIHIRIELVDEVELAAPEAQQLQFAILLDLQPDGIQIRQRDARSRRASNSSDCAAAGHRRRACTRPTRKGRARRILCRTSRADKTATSSNCAAKAATGPGKRTVAVDGDAHLVSTSPGAERNASPTGRMQRRVHQLVHGVRHVLRK